MCAALAQQFEANVLILCAPCSIAVFVQQTKLMVFILLFRSILFPGNIQEEWSSFGGYSGNVFKALALSPKIIANRPYFYKML